MHRLGSGLTASLKHTQRRRGSTEGRGRKHRTYTVGASTTPVPRLDGRRMHHATHHRRKHPWPASPSAKQPVQLSRPPLEAVVCLTGAAAGRSPMSTPLPLIRSRTATRESHTQNPRARTRGQTGNRRARAVASGAEGHRTCAHQASSPSLRGRGSATARPLTRPAARCTTSRLAPASTTHIPTLRRVLAPTVLF